MLAYISGKVVVAKAGWIIVKAPSGVGYGIFVATHKNYMVNENVDIFLLEITRDNSSELYGFDNMDQRGWVERLLKVSGIGPKMAANIVFSMHIDEIVEAISKADSKAFSTSVKGLGAKTAKKIIVELKDSSVDLATLTSKKLPNDNFAIEFADTLSGLGYKRGEIVAAITTLKKDNLWQENDIVETVRNGLRVLGRG
jgi:holliday junction DNA helicase RuvA